MDRYRTQLIIKQPIKMTPNEYKVLKALQNAPTDKTTNNQMGALNYGELSKKTKLSREVLAGVVKQLMKQGHVEYLRGIVARNGKSAGSGFRLPTYPTSIKRKIISSILDYEATQMIKFAKQPTKKTATNQPSKDEVPTKSPTKLEECTPCTETKFHIEIKRSGMTAKELFWVLADLVGFFSGMIVLVTEATNGKPLNEKNWVMVIVALVLTIWISIKR